MTSMSNMGMTLAELEQLLDVYGGDRVRWPAEARTGAAQLVARDAGREFALKADGWAVHVAAVGSPLAQLWWLT